MEFCVLSVLVTAACALAGLAAFGMGSVVGAGYVVAGLAARNPERAAKAVRWLGYAVR